MKYGMHILDDLDGLSARARDLLNRTGWREPPPDSRLATEFLQVRDCSGRQVPAPAVLAIRREGFEQRYGGLRYQVRNSYAYEGERHEVTFGWRYDLEQDAWADSARGWYFSWFGEHAATPVRWLVHTDGRAGVDDGGGKFLEIAPSVPALIESHALTDMVAAWDRTRSRSTASPSPSRSEASPTFPRPPARPPGGGPRTQSLSRNSGTGAVRSPYAAGAHSSGLEAQTADARSNRQPKPRGPKGSSIPTSRLRLTVLIPRNFYVDVAFHSAGVIGQGQPGCGGVLVAADADGE